MDTEIKFGETLSIEDFKAKHNGTTLKIIRNPKTGKLFMSINGKTVGAVSKNYNKEDENKEIVELILPETGESIYCLHNGNSDNIEEML